MCQCVCDLDMPAHNAYSMGQSDLSLSHTYTSIDRLRAGQVEEGLLTSKSLFNDGLKAFTSK